MVEDPLLDRYGGNPNITHTIGINHLKKIKQKYNLTDIWPKENLDKKFLLIIIKISKYIVELIVFIYYKTKKPKILL